MKIEENVALAKITTMRLGGKARYVIDVENLEDVQLAFDFAETRGLPVWMMGRGANSIGRDEGFPGVVIRNRIKGLAWEGDGVLVAGGGEKWDDVVKFACQGGYSGIEAMAAIPGTAGAAPVQNIGAYGQDISQTLIDVTAFDRFLQEVKIIPKEEMQFSYRKSIFNSGAMAGRYFIMEIRLQLQKGVELKPPFYTSLQKYVDEHKITDFSPQNIYKIVSTIRAEKIPDPEKEASAGSFFKNVYLTDAEADEAEAAGVLVWRENGEHLPSAKVHKVNAGWLIEEAGLLGKMFHGFRVNEKAGLILVNEAGQSYADLVAAREEIRQIIRDKFGFVLEQEPVEVEA